MVIITMESSVLGKESQFTGKNIVFFRLNLWRFAGAHPGVGGCFFLAVIRPTSWGVFFTLAVLNSAATSIDYGVLFCHCHCL